MTPTSLITAKGRNESRRATASAPGNGKGKGRSWSRANPAQSQGWVRRASLALKQAMDFTIATVFLLLAAPLFIVMALLIKITSPGPIFFMQQRVGRRGKLFGCYKFRTMQHNSDDGLHREFSRNFIRGNGNGNGNGAAKAEEARRQSDDSTAVYKLTRDPRITRIGSFLRRTSLDELPQLWNVLRGEMSLVGPRPPVVYELEHYEDWHKRRLDAKPGITGLWQVSGRSSVPFDEMVQLDIYYIDHRTMLMDLWIMARTLPVMIKGDGAY